MLFLRIVGFVSITTMVTGHIVQHHSGQMTYLYKKKNVHRNVGSTHKNRRLELVNDLASKYNNWDLCTNAYFNESFTPMNSLVPNNTIFLATYPTNKFDNKSATCRSKTITRTATIGVGLQTIFYPLMNTFAYDFDDDADLQICANFTNETLAQRLELGEYYNTTYNDEAVVELLYAEVDGVPVKSKYAYNPEPYYFDACPDNKTKTDEEYSILGGAPEGDTCDKEPFDVIDGLDAYPMIGWYGIDTRDWVDGEIHTFEFGSLSKCQTGKYVITAVKPDDGKCGLFGLGFFCISKWWKWLCSLFT